MSATDTTIRVSGGELRGSVVKGIRRFLAIPYAAPPFGEHRFAPPQPPLAWSGQRDATEFGPTAPQRPYPGRIGNLLDTVEIPGEETLTLNVWTPVEAAAAPVVVWIHGGALEHGTSAINVYDGTAFARDGVVFVSINYRLGVEGFSVLEGVEPNLGLRDCAAALKWVHDEIAAFGGDSSKITLMGESAGGMMVAALLCRPSSRPLVARAIIQSAPLEAKPLRTAGKSTHGIAKVLHIPATGDAWREKTPDQLLDGRTQAMKGWTALSRKPLYTLALDEEVTVSPHKALADIDIPILIGTNTEEYRLWLTADEVASVSWIKLLVARLALGIPFAASMAVRRAFPGANSGEILGQLITELMFRKPAIDVALHKQESTFVYEFAWKSPLHDLGAAHALEIGFAFDALATAGAIKMGGEDTPQKLADEMHGAWVRFIRTGDPGWPAFGSEQVTRVFDTTSETTTLPRANVVDAMRH